MDRQRGEGVVAPQPSRALLDEVSQVRLASGAARLAARRCITASSAAASRYNRTLLRCSEAASTTAGLCQDAIQVRGAQPAAGSLEWSVLRPFAQRLGWPFDGLPPPSVGDAATARSLVRIHEGLIELARTSEVRNRGDAEARALRVTLLEARAAHWRSEVHRLTGVHLDGRTRTLTHGSGAIQLTPREMQLWVVLTGGIDRWFTADELIWRAWGSDSLSGEQLRIYIARLRRHLVDLAIPWTIRNRPGNGYSLGPSDASQPSAGRL